MTSLDEVNARVMAALKLLSTEDADKLAQGHGPEYRVLLSAMPAITELWVAALRTNRIRGRRLERLIEITAKTQIILLQIVHLAYALGVQRGGRRDA